MKNTLFLVLIAISVNSIAQDLWIKNNSIQKIQSLDTAVFYFNPNSIAFFDDKEYISDIKKGYTLPGFSIQPQIKFQPSLKTRMSAGFHVLYFGGTDSLEKFVPVLSLEYSLNKDIHIILGTLYSEELHFLPEPLYKPERLFTSTPETGFQILTITDKIKVDNWNTWERYIKNGSPFQEVFTVGLTGIFKPNTFNVNNGLTLQFYGLAVHNGGQIDSTNLKVTTMFNIGMGVGYAIPTFGKSVSGVEVMGFISSDKSPNPVSKYQNGRAFYPKVFIEWPQFRAEFGYWKSSKFVNPRGEELFGSYSTIRSQFDEKERNLITAKLIYSKEVTKGFNVGARFDTYYDYNASIIDWAFTLKISFNKNILLKR